MRANDIFSKSNLFIMGLHDTVYQLYNALVDLYDGAATQTSKETLSFTEKVDECCEKEAIRLIDRFISRYTHFFISDKAPLQIVGTGLKPFSMLQERKGQKSLQIEITIVSYTIFLEKLFDLIVRMVLHRRREDKPRLTYEVVEGEILERMNHIISQYRKRMLVEHADDFTVDGGELFVYANFSSLSCNLSHHKVIPAEYIAKRVSGSGYVVLSVHRCETCGRIFIGKYTLSLYESEFGKLDILLRQDSDMMATGGFEGIGLETQLHREGYTVSTNRLSERERRALLIRLLEIKKMDYFEIVRDIKTAINTQKHLPGRAIHVERWKGDLDFLRQYMDKRR